MGIIEQEVKRVDAGEVDTAPTEKVLDGEVKKATYEATLKSGFVTGARVVIDKLPMSYTRVDKFMEDRQIDPEAKDKVFMLWAWRREDASIKVSVQSAGVTEEDLAAFAKSLRECLLSPEEQTAIKK